jgi:hypothetical protein
MYSCTILTNLLQLTAASFNLLNFTANFTHHNTVLIHITSYLQILMIIISTGGDVWVLVIKDAKPSDSGIYVCEVNSSPILRSFHKLSGEYRVLKTTYTCHLFISSNMFLRMSVTED